ncbi:MAG TPA: isoleucine--tRNA ligase [Bacteroidia bacterium]|jgi:isoleucyl-tRNA synthetase|nr:isoleucine--tRNA ligase [Bacteroidia bacterium]
MSKKYTEYKQLNLSQVGKDVLKLWQDNKTFERSVTEREGKAPFVFYEGPPSANGMPGIHHVMARAIKDIFCRYKTQKGFQVKRKAGWDTHGLPIELAVEKSLGITKEDIGNKNSARYISVEDYNKACRKEVMKYTDKWEDLTAKMGYWVDMQHPYITYDNKYIESCWWLLKNLHEKNLLYKGFTIQPYSPAAGTGLSSHELNQPGCYRNVKDRTATVMFKLSQNSEVKNQKLDGDVYFLAWTTTPWTLPSNTALAVGKNIDYILVKTFNPHPKAGEEMNEIMVILAKDLLHKYFPEKNTELKPEAYKAGDKNIPFQIIKEFKGSDLEGITYEQLLPFSQPTDGNAFCVVSGDFVTTEDGTGIVHIAPSFGADDFRVAKQNGIGSLTLVDKRGKFLPEVQDGVFLYGEEYVKEAYLTDEEKKTEFEKQKKILEANHKIKDLKVYLSVDERIVLKLQEEGKLFKKETYEHSYPHCWRTDKPVLYYPLDSWFIKTTNCKEQMIALNKTINWKPESTGTGRFGSWLENLNDWNLSRSRFWGIPLPIWTSEDKSEQLVIGSAEDLKKEIENALAKEAMKENPLANFTAGNFSKENYDTFDLHKPYADTIVLEKNGKKLFREPDLIDVWFDSGAMPYAQLHYPFENKELVDNKKYYPADFIAEGVDQTRGWFFTLHAIATMCFNSVAYKNVVSNGLVLDKNGNKMSKRLGNAVDPFETLEKYGPDATRWYMITNAAPWDNLKFDVEGISEVQRKFFGTLHNTYSFFALYANVDGFTYSEKDIPVSQRPEIDRWILSELNSLIKIVDEAYNTYEPHRAGRAIEYFVDEHLSNWYVRLCRRRFWKGDYSEDKIAAYQTLYRCLEVIAQLSAPIAPFFTDRLFGDLNAITGRNKANSIHLSDFPVVDEKLIDKLLEERMELAQKISSMVLSIRKKENIRVRQPLNKIQIPVLDDTFRRQVHAVQELILAEVNVKEIEFVDESKTQIIKNLKLNFKTLGKKCGKNMKAVQSYAADHSHDIILSIEKTGKYDVKLAGETITLETEDVEIIPVDIPGWKVANSGPVTVALDITITEPLKQEGIARELVNRIQNIRKDKGFEVTDKINVSIARHDMLDAAIKNNLTYICSETLTKNLNIVEKIDKKLGLEVEVDENVSTIITIEKI